MYIISSHVSVVYPCSGENRCCHCSQCSNIFPETTWPIKAKLHVEHPWGGGTKVGINGLGHMTKMANMPIYGKNFLKSSLELVDQFQRKWVCSIRDSGPS